MNMGTLSADSLLTHCCIPPVTGTVPERCLINSCRIHNEYEDARVSSQRRTYEHGLYVNTRARAHTHTHVFTRRQYKAAFRRFEESKLGMNNPYG